MKTKVTEGMNSYYAQKNNNDTTPEEDFVKLKEMIGRTANEILPKHEGKAHKSWMNNEILHLMQERRKAKQDFRKYNTLNKEIKRLCNVAHEKYLNEICEEAEKLYNISPREAHKQIKNITGKFKTKNQTGCLKDKNGNILMEEQEILKRWHDYIEELYDDTERPDKPFKFSEPMSGPAILKNEIENAMKHMKANKAVGSDNIPVEILMALEEVGVNTLQLLFNKIYNTGTIPGDMIRSIFIALPKKPGTMECENHRTISLMSHCTKILLKVIMQRNKKKIHDEISEEQYGFMPDKGTRNAVFVLKNIAERAIEVQKDLYLAFIDYKKAFDRVRHDEILDMLNKINMDDKDLRLIQNLYYDQSAVIRVGDNVTEECAIKKGVRQGCVLSPDLFSLYSEIILRELIGEPGIKIGGTNINNLRFADDTVLIADSEQKLQNLVNVTNISSVNKGMELNVKKTECMVITKKNENEIPNCNILVNGEKLEQVNSFKYLGTRISWNAKDDQEIKIRTAQAKATFEKLKNVLTNKNMSFVTRYRVLKCYVYSVFTYNCEAWTISATMAKKINAFEMWAFRKMQRISWTTRTTNEAVLRQVNQGRNLLNNIKCRQARFLGHVMRKGKLEHLSLTGKIDGKRARGRQRRKYLEQLTERPNEMIQATYDRTTWREFIKEAADGWNS